MKPPLKTSASLLLLAAFSGVLATPAAAQSFSVIPAIPNGTTYQVVSISGDGSTAIGAGSRNGHNTPFLWSAGQGSYDIGLDSVGPDRSQFAQAISADGTTVVGASFGSPLGGPNGNTAYRWTGPGTYQTLSPANGRPDSRANAVSADGSIVAGIYGSNFGDSIRESSTACYWDSQGVVHTLTGLPGLRTSADAISGDGQVIVGRAYGGSTERAFRWSQADGYQQLPSLTGVPNRNSEQAEGANFDGSIIVGESNLRAVKWENGAVVPLLSGVPTSEAAVAWAVSGDGAVITGTLRDLVTGQSTAAIWTASTGFIAASDYLSRNGVAIPAGLRILSTVPISISADGRTIGGSAFSVIDRTYYGWVATIPAPSTMLISLPLLAGVVVRRRR